MWDLNTYFYKLRKSSLQGKLNCFFYEKPNFHLLLYFPLFLLIEKQENQLHEFFFSLPNLIENMKKENVYFSRDNFIFHVATGNLVIKSFKDTFGERI